MSLYNVGDKVLIVSKRTGGMNFSGKMDKWLSSVMTISKNDDGRIKMLEDWGNWAWSEDMIVGFAEDKKVEVHPDFEKWYNEIKTGWELVASQKAYGIMAINQMGFGHGLLNSKKEDISGDYPELRDEMQRWKEKYTRAILDGYILKEEKLYTVKLPGLKRNKRDIYLMKEGSRITIDWSPIDYMLDKTNAIRYQFTEREIKKIDGDYWKFAKEVVK